MFLMPAPAFQSSVARMMISGLMDLTDWTKLGGFLFVVMRRLNFAYHSTFAPPQ
jgi:hypothetical protein